MIPAVTHDTHASCCAATIALARADAASLMGWAEARNRSTDGSSRLHLALAGERIAALRLCEFATAPTTSSIASLPRCSGPIHPNTPTLAKSPEPMSSHEISLAGHANSHLSARRYTRHTSYKSASRAPGMTADEYLQCTSVTTSSDRSTCSPTKSDASPERSSSMRTSNCSSARR